MKKFVFPGESLTVKPDKCFPVGSEVVVEPRVCTKTYHSYGWPSPQVSVISSGGNVVLENDTELILPVPKDEQLCQISAITSVSSEHPSTKSPKSKQLFASKPYSASVIVDSDNQLSPQEKELFVNAHLKHDELFKPVIGRYNDAAGKVRARVNVYM